MDIVIVLAVRIILYYLIVGAVFTVAGILPYTKFCNKNNFILEDICDKIMITCLILFAIPIISYLAWIIYHAVIIAYNGGVL